MGGRAGSQWEDCGEVGGGSHGPKCGNGLWGPGGFMSLIASLSSLGIMIRISPSFTSNVHSSSSITRPLLYKMVFYQERNIAFGGHGCLNHNPS